MYAWAVLHALPPEAHRDSQRFPETPRDYMSYPQHLRPKGTAPAQICFFIHKYLQFPLTNVWFLPDVTAISFVICMPNISKWPDLVRPECEHLFGEYFGVAFRGRKLTPNRGHHLLTPTVGVNCWCPRFGFIFRTQKVTPWCYPAGAVHA